MLQLQQIIGKAFRLAKRWYAGYIVAQITLIFAAYLTLNVNPVWVAILSFVGVLIVELLRWRSDVWKAEGELWKSKWEKLDGLGRAEPKSEIAEWLALKGPDFLDDIKPVEIQGSTFCSKLAPSPRRLVENTQESAWFSRLQCSRLRTSLFIFLVCFVVLSMLALNSSVASLSSVEEQAALQAMVRFICSVLTLAISINVVRLIADYHNFENACVSVLAGCKQLLEGNEVSEPVALELYYSYQTARAAAPLLPSTLWLIHKKHLEDKWEAYKQG
jgi:hypothetical protein